MVFLGKHVLTEHPNMPEKIVVHQKTNIASYGRAHEPLFLRALPAKRARKYVASAEGASEEKLAFWVVVVGPKNTQNCSQIHSERVSCTP